MTNSDITPDPVVRVAIDISKHRHDILIAIPGKRRRQRMTIRNNCFGFAVEPDDGVKFPRYTRAG